MFSSYPVTYLITVLIVSQSSNLSASEEAAKSSQNLVMTEHFAFQTLKVSPLLKRLSGDKKMTRIFVSISDFNLYVENTA